MKFKKSIFSALATLFLVSPVFAELVFPSLSYRTGAYGPNGIPFADQQQISFAATRRLQARF